MLIVSALIPNFERVFSSLDAAPACIICPLTLPANSDIDSMIYGVVVRAVEYANSLTNFDLLLPRLFSQVRKDGAWDEPRPHVCILYEENGPAADARFTGFTTSLLFFCIQGAPGKGVHFAPLMLVVATSASFSHFCLSPY